MPAYSPVDQTQGPSGRNRKLSATESIWERQQGRSSVSSRSISFIHPGADRWVVLEQHFLVRGRSSHKINPFPDAERVRNRHAGMMQLPQHLHAGGHLLRVLCIRIPSALIILGDLVAGFSVKIQNMFGNAKRCDRLVNNLLLFPVNQKFCSRTRNAADIMFSIQFKQERLVCHTRFETADVVYRFLFLH